MIPNDFIQTLLSRIDIVDVIDRHVPLKKAGANFAARCPFHNEKSPSFTVSPTKQFYHCFGCGAHGTAIKFLIEYDRMEFLDAVEELAQRAGMQVPREPSRTGPTGEHEGLYAALDAAAKLFQRNLAGSQRAKDYLAKRGIDAAA